MNQRVKVLYDEAQKLDPAEREELAELLLATIEPDPGMEAAWLDEAKRRWDDHVADPTGAIDAFDAIDEARQKLRRREGA